jgi:hypothetical protein
MSDNSTEQPPDLLYLNCLFPEPSAALSTQPEPLESVLKDCVVLLDTNVLLAPYGFPDRDLLDQIKNIYRPLLDRKMLFVPGQAMREFLKQRQFRYRDLYLKFREWKGGNITRNFPAALGASEAREIIMDLDKEINRLLQERDEIVQSLIDQVRSWRWNDPVTTMYRDLFGNEAIVDPPLSGKDIETELHIQNSFQVPPGYEDATKPDRGVGDRLIWWTILHVGSTHRKHVVFVSNERKRDWWVVANKEALYPRFELVNEFWNRTDGKSFYIQDFREFLKSRRASPELIEEAEREQLAAASVTYPMTWIRSRRAKEAAEQWLRAEFEDAAIHALTFSWIDFKIEESGGRVFFVRIESVRESPETMLRLVQDASTHVRGLGRSPSELMVVIVAYSMEQAWEVQNFISTHGFDVSDVDVRVGFIDSEGNFQAVNSEDGL